MVDDTIGIIMKYPSMDRFIEAEFLNKDIKTEEVFDFIADCIEQVYQGDEVWDMTTTTKKELKEWIGTFTTKQFEEINRFYETMPKLKHEFTVVNPKTKVESTYTVEGLQSFFA